MNIAGLDAAVRAVCPIDGVGADGTIWFRADATDAQKAAAAQVVAGFSLSAPSIDDVARERARRLSLGFDYTFADARGIHHIGTTDDDMRGWDEVSKSAQAFINSGQGATASISIVTNTGPCSVTPNEWQQILLAAYSARQPLYAASFVLETSNPIPADYASDVHWS